MTTNPPSGHHRVLGHLDAVHGIGVVRMEDTYDTDIQDLWEALTDPARLARWLGEVDGDLRPQGRFRARFASSGWAGTGVVEACEPPHHWRVRTVDDDEGEEHVVEARLTSAGDRTVLVIEERGMPVDQLAAYGAGIQVHVEDLAAHLAGRDRVDAQARWTDLLPAYEALAAELD